MKDASIYLFEGEKNCSGCAACLNICPKDAIYMQEDEMGFLYPRIDEKKCIRCGKCQQVCNYQKGKIGKNTKKTYAGMALDDNILINSSSGGIFATIAKAVLMDKGTVFGCSLELHKDGLHPEHIRIENINEIHKLQGSKYVQSNIGNVYRLVSMDLRQGKFVLFSGTPCQVDALYGFLGKKDYPNLFTIDIICHGVPSERMFIDYIHAFEERLKGKIINISFRDKRDGWGLKGAVEYLNKRGKKRRHSLPISLSSYYKLFLTSEIYRESCYSCKYAGNKRVGDITLGDYWGIELEHPDALIENGGVIDSHKGVSCILINSEKGEKMLHKMCRDLSIQESTFEKAAHQNGQLNKPSVYTEKRKYVFDLYKRGGYEAVDKWFIQSLGWKQYAYKLKHVFGEKWRSR